MIRRICLCYLFLAALLFVYAEVRQTDEQNVPNEWSEQ